MNQSAPYFSRAGETFRVKETARRCKKLGEDLLGVLRKAAKEAGRPEKTAGVRCYGFNNRQVRIKCLETHKTALRRKFWL